MKQRQTRSFDTFCSNFWQEFLKTCCVKTGFFKFKLQEWVQGSCQWIFFFSSSVISLRLVSNKQWGNSCLVTSPHAGILLCTSVRMLKYVNMHILIILSRHYVSCLHYLAKSKVKSPCSTLTTNKFSIFLDNCLILSKKKYTNIFFWFILWPSCSTIKLCS